MNDLTSRLLAEIERRERAYSPPLYAHEREARAYLAALRTIVEMHRRNDLWCGLCGTADGSWPCATLLEIAGALGVEG